MSLVSSFGMKADRRTPASSPGRVVAVVPLAAAGVTGAIACVVAGGVVFGTTRAACDAVAEPAWATPAGFESAAMAADPAPAADPTRLAARRSFRPPAARASIRYVLSVLVVMARPLSPRCAAMAGSP